jgi:NADPH:quinone reductase-like Zn-dependent oxidoreductase
MKAVVMTGYGGPEVLRVQELPTPVPGRGQVLVRVHAAGVNPIDWRVRKGTLKEFVRIKPPLVLGAEVAGEVAAVGPGVARLKAGQRVYSKLPGDIGGYAEYVVVREDQAAPCPANLTPVQSASVPVGALTSLQSLRDKGELRPGQSVLVNGASGGVGMYAVQLALALGAKVTAVCSAANIPFVRELGAAETLDYKHTDFTRLGRRWNVIFDVSATRKLSECRASLEPGGAYITTISSFGDLLMPLWNPFRSRKGRFIIVKPSVSDLEFARGLIEAGTLRPAVERVFPLDEAGEAQTLLENERPRGKVVLEIAA